MTDFKVSTHDRGAFGELLGRLKAAGYDCVMFDCDLTGQGDDCERWVAMTWRRIAPLGSKHHRSGRTGEEALRRLVETVTASTTGHIPDSAVNLDGDE